MYLTITRTHANPLRPSDLVFDAPARDVQSDDRAVYVVTDDRRVLTFPNPRRLVVDRAA